MRLQWWPQKISVNPPLREMGLKEVVGIKLLEPGLAQNRLSKYASCHDAYYHDYPCSRRHQGLCLSGDKGMSCRLGMNSSAWRWCIRVLHAKAVSGLTDLHGWHGWGQGHVRMAILVPAVCHPPGYWLQALWEQGAHVFSLGSLVLSAQRHNTYCDYYKTCSTKHLLSHESSSCLPYGIIT